MNSIQYAAMNDMSALDIPIVEQDSTQLTARLNGMEFRFYKNTKVFNLGELTQVKVVPKNTFVPGTNWSFACFPEVTDTVNDHPVVLWKSDDNTYVIANHIGEAIMSFSNTTQPTAQVDITVLNERRKFARGWESVK